MLFLILFPIYASTSSENILDDGNGFTNSLGMKFVKIPPGSFIMGDDNGDYDEKPAHKVNITKEFYMGAVQVTNEQYEQFDPKHKELRNKSGFSKEDNEAAIFVSWHDAVAFCKWLSKKEGKAYRLPTEAEWEYAARAGTTTNYNTGDSLSVEFHRNQNKTLIATPVQLFVGQTKPNLWGLFDMHGLVEEWVYDWYGPYTKEEKNDPIGREGGLIKISRGGSHGTPVEFLRSSVRMGTIPEDKSWMIGFRLVLGEMPNSFPLNEEKPRKWQKNVTNMKYSWDKSFEGPYFSGPKSFVNTAIGVDGPIYSRHYSTNIKTSHVNHLPSVTYLDNGDMFASWFSSKGDARDMTIAASRLIAGCNQWTEADVFLNAPKRKQNGLSLINDGQGSIFWFNGLSVADGGQYNNILIMRYSKDNGKTWTPPSIINPDRNDRNRPNQPIDNIDNATEPNISSDGKIQLLSDTDRIPGGGTVVQFVDLNEGTIEYSEGTISGIHARMVKLNDGRLLALGRSLTNTAPTDKLPMSISYDQGNNWEYIESEFPAIAGGQRHLLMRLQEGPLLLVSFTGPNKEGGIGMLFKDIDGNEFRGYGMFGAVSYDEGETWPVKKLITPADGKTYDGRGATGFFTATQFRAEHAGYLTAVQTPNKIIHLFSSGLHYEFNLEWMLKPVASVEKNFESID
jgi:formylglycine-generating enzyme